MAQIIFRSFLEILLVLATAFFVEKARGYAKYIKRRYVNEDKPMPTHTLINLTCYIGIAVIGFFDIYDNLQKILKLF